MKTLTLTITTMLAISLPFGCKTNKTKDESTSEEVVEIAGSRARAPVSGDKIALIIANSNYDKSASGWHRINTERDVAFMKAALRRHGFGPDAIEVVEDADRAEMQAALDRLVERAEAGYVVALHYSGHGDRLPDDEPDEELDGLDEALVPIGAPQDHGKPGASEKYLRDDEFGEAITRLRRKLKKDGNLLVSIDACHSGTGTRGTAVVRGRTEQIYEPDPVEDDPEAGGLLEGAVSRGGTPDMAPTVVMSAARHDEVAMETYDNSKNPVGSLSYTLAHALARASGQTTYESLFDDVRTNMAEKVPGQTPQIEGEVDTLVFDGELFDRPPHLNVVKARDGAVDVDGGTLVGLVEGTVLEFHPRDADPEKAEPLATGTIVSSDAEGATVHLTETAKGVGPKKLVELWAYVRSRGFGDVRLELAFERDFGGDRTRVEKALKTTKLIDVSEVGTDGLVVWEAGKVILRDASDETSLSPPLDPNSSTFDADLGKYVRRQLRRKLLIGLDVDADDIAFDVGVIPANVPDVDTRSGSECDLDRLEPRDAAQHRTPGGQYVFADQERFIFEIRNRSSVPAHVTILGVFGDGTIAQMFPKRNENAEIPPDTELLHPTCITVQPPAGLDAYKVFMTREPTDFSTVLQNPDSKIGSRGAGTLQGYVAEAAALVDGSPDRVADEIEERGGSASTVKQGAGATKTVFIRAVETPEKRARLVRGTTAVAEQ